MNIKGHGVLYIMIANILFSVAFNSDKEMINL